MSHEDKDNPFFVDTSHIPPSVIDAEWLGYDDQSPEAGHAPTPHNPRLVATLGDAVLAEAQPKRTAHTGNLYLAIGNSPRRPDNGFIEPTAPQRAEITRALTSTEGVIATEDITPETVVAGIETARESVSSDKAKALLGDLKFQPNTKMPAEKKPLRIIMGGDMAIDPRHIVGAQSLTSWQGKGYQSGRYGGFTNELVKKQEQGASVPPRASIDVIEDYATRGTQLPMNSEVSVFLTDKGMFAYAYDSHRVAAAQLRREPVRVDVMSLYDYRGADLSSRVQAQIDEAIEAVESNKLR